MGLQRPRRLEGVPGPRVILWGKGDEGPGWGAGHTQEPTFPGGQLAPPEPQFLRPPCSHPALLLIPSPFPCSSCILVHLCSAPANKHLPRPGRGREECSKTTPSTTTHCLAQARVLQRGRAPVTGSWSRSPPARSARCSITGCSGGWCSEAVLPLMSQKEGSAGREAL